MKDRGRLPSLDHDDDDDDATVQAVAPIRVDPSELVATRLRPRFAFPEPDLAPPPRHDSGARLRARLASVAPPELEEPAERAEPEVDIPVEVQEPKTEWELAAAAGVALVPAAAYVPDPPPVVQAPHEEPAALVATRLDLGRADRFFVRRRLRLARVVVGAMIVVVAVPAAVVAVLMMPAAPVAPLRARLRGPLDAIGIHLPAD